MGLCQMDWTCQVLSKHCKYFHVFIEVFASQCKIWWRCCLSVRYDPSLLLHGQQYIEVYRPLPSKASVSIYYSLPLIYTHMSSAKQFLCDSSMTFRILIVRFALETIQRGRFYNLLLILFPEWFLFRFSEMLLLFLNAVN